MIARGHGVLLVLVLPCSNIRRRKWDWEGKKSRDRENIVQKKNALEETKAHQNCNSNHLRIQIYIKCSVLVLLITLIYIFSPSTAY